MAALALAQDGSGREGGSMATLALAQDGSGREGVAWQH